MRYWLCITNDENWEVVREKRIWGVSERHRRQISEVKPGDALVFYVKQKLGKEAHPPLIAGIFTADSEPFEDDSEVFVPIAGEKFPYRVRLKEKLVPKKPIEFKPLIPELKFITNKDKWSGHLMGKAMREIPEEDYERILKAVKEEGR